MPGTEYGGRVYTQTLMAERRQVNVTDLGKPFGSVIEEFKEAVSRPHSWSFILLPVRLLSNVRYWLADPACCPSLCL